MTGSRAALGTTPGSGTVSRPHRNHSNTILGPGDLKPWLSRFKCCPRRAALVTCPRKSLSSRQSRKVWGECGGSPGKSTSEIRDRSHTKRCSNFLELKSDPTVPDYIGLDKERDDKSSYQDRLGCEMNVVSKSAIAAGSLSL